MMDADLNHQPEELGYFFDALKGTGADIVIGSRYVKGARIYGMPAWKLFLSKRVNDFLTVFAALRVRDKTSGYRLIRRGVVEKITPLLAAKKFDFYVEFLARAHWLGYAMREVPITFINRKRGFSKMKKLDTLFSYLKLFFRIKKIEPRN
jgi:dolichol-phosphate mannosyltransferase